ncbi:MAG: DUF465 domain-containing protein, partial [Chitinophagia bacterium]|nr:DUF465 domain-containing protein [Chitinophagia bacterium]
PGMKKQIHVMKKADSFFASTSDKYDELEHSIHRIESGVEEFTDEHLQALKKKRLKLKDELLAMLKKSEKKV